MLGKEGHGAGMLKSQIKHVIAPQPNRGIKRREGSGEREREREREEENP